MAIVLQLVGVGWYLASCVIICLVGGLWLDGRLGTLPIFTLVGVVLGLVVAFYGAYRMVLPLLNQDQDVEK